MFDHTRSVLKWLCLLGVGREFIQEENEPYISRGIPTSAFIALLLIVGKSALLGVSSSCQTARETSGDS